MTQNVSICIVLDRQVREDPDMVGRVSVLLFDTEGIDRIRDDVAIASCLDVAPEEYQPRGGTPLLDAVGHAVELLEKRSRSDARSIIVIMTDGHENSSREHTKETISALLKRKQEESNWLMIYLGADHNAWDQAGHLGFAAANTAQFSKGALFAVGPALYQRSSRYSKSASAKDDRELGFSAEERSGMKGK